LLTLALFGQGYLSETIRGPQFQKLRDCRRAVALKVIVRVCVDQHTAFHDLVAEIDPTAEFGGAMNSDNGPAICGSTSAKMCFRRCRIGYHLKTGVVNSCRLAVTDSPSSAILIQGYS
jgi:hypothetical protein